MNRDPFMAPDQERERRILLGLAHEWELACRHLGPVIATACKNHLFVWRT